MKSNSALTLGLTIFLIWIGLLPSSLYGQEVAPEQNGKPSTFLIISRTTDEVADPEFENVIEGYVKVELQQRRLEVRTEADLKGSGPEFPPGETSAGDMQATAMRIGRKAKVDFLILCSYRKIWPQMEMRFDCYDIREGNLVLTQTTRRSPALLLDWSISDVIDQVLEAIGPRLVYLEVPPEGQASTDEPQEGVGAIPTGSREGVEPIPYEAPPPPAFAPVEPVENPLEVSLRLSPLVAVGAAADYFRLGFFPAVNGSYRLYTPAGYLSLGLSLGLVSFYAESPSAQAQGYLIPMAATVGFLRPFPGSRLTLQLRLASGPALFVLAPLSADPQVKVLAYLASGIGAELSLSPAWGFRLELDYSVFFEKPQPIMGYAPAVYGFFRF
jgi:hypothetical protein